MWKDYLWLQRNRFGFERTNEKRFFNCLIKVSQLTFRALRVYNPVFDTSSVIKTQKPFVYKGF